MCNSMAVVVIFSDVPLLCFLVVYKPKRKYAAFGVVLNSEIVVLSFPDTTTTTSDNFLVVSDFAR